MEKKVHRIAVTGGAGQIAYSLLFRIAKGELFGADHPVSLHLLDLPQGQDALKGVAMELNDCAYPLLKELKIGSDPKEVFEGVDVAFLVGAKPRGPGMERKDLLSENGKIFVEQGKAINKVANKDVRVLVVGNPCNTNCLICMHNAPDIPRNQFFAMTRLDQNRAMYQLAKKANVDVREVSNVTIWGNHSATQVPDFSHARIRGKPLRETIKDEAWLKNDFFQLIQQRGASVIKARGKSSAASAANAALDSIRSVFHSTAPENWFSAGIDTKNNPYGIDEDLVFSFPLRTNQDGSLEIVKDLSWDDFLQEKIQKTEQELKEERDLVRNLL